MLQYGNRREFLRVFGVGTGVVFASGQAAETTGRVAELDVPKGRAVSSRLRMHSIVGAILFVITLPALGCRPAGSPGIEKTSADSEQLVRITAKRFEYSPAEVHVKRGVPVALELTSLDHVHGFAAPDLNVRSDIPPGVITSLRFVPERSGRFSFHCDVFCGSGHDDMTGEIVVDD